MEYNFFDKKDYPIVIFQYTDHPLCKDISAEIDFREKIIPVKKSSL